MSEPLATRSDRCPATVMSGLRRRLLCVGFVAAVVPTLSFADCKLVSLELPVTMVGGRALVTVRIDDKPVKLALDSGAFYSMLTEAAAAELELPLDPLPPGRVMGVTGELKVRSTRVKRLQLSAGEINNVEFLVGGNEPGRGAQGLLGRNLLGATDTEYDLANGVVRLTVPNGVCAKDDLVYWAGTAPVSEIALRPASVTHPALVGMAKVNGRPVSALFDTGAMSVLTLATAEGLGLSDAHMRKIGQVYGAGKGAASAWIGRVESFEIGDERVGPSDLVVADFKFTEADMLLGIDFFLSHRVYVSKQRSRMYFTYNGGPIFAMDMAAKVALASPAGDPSASVTLPSAAAYSRRGAATASRGDLAGALRDFDRACELEPEVAGHYTQRSAVLVALKRFDAALGDLEMALKLEPGDADARLRRALVLEVRKDLEGALADVQVLDNTISPQSHIRLAMARLYLRHQQFEQALPQLNQWITAHGSEARLDVALNARCWAKAMLNIDLDAALEDCNAAVESQPANISYLDSRAWVQIRRARYRDAMNDFQRAAKVGSLPAWSLYGRGITRYRLGDQEGGQADIDAARKALPLIDADAARRGITVM